MLIILMFTEPLLPSSPTQDTGKKFLRNGIVYIVYLLTKEATSYCQ
ncbi:MAG: hypothetical protein O4808_17675 [Trichodesmium sp. St17_bin3_1_1]|jgi:hypothetical protein|nr:hypothetical protein [Trichodesmium sp. St17_bin3_1_1]